jgi:hypothetical protein
LVKLIGQINWSKSFKSILGFVAALRKQDRILVSAFALLEALSFAFVRVRGHNNLKSFGNLNLLVPGLEVLEIWVDH